MKESAATAKFLEARARLNPEQRAAVESIEGPVMVLAGPGTGKTQVLAFRIAEILTQTDVSPRNILALTFTESGVTAMRERLLSLIGVTAYGVGIYTFHSFANRVINDAGAAFYKTHTLDPIDDITQLQLIMDILDAHLELETLRPPRAPYFYVKPIVSALRSLKNEGVTPERLRELCLTDITSLQHDPASISKAGKSKGELKQSVKDEIEKLERSVALADVFAAYESALEEKGLYDYEDMILFIIQSFETNAELLAKYQEQFQYILVDEYQDTNTAQNNLVRLLSDYFDTPNIFVVGDDKQSIYRFQGASVANLVTFREWYPMARVVSLQQNYRSGQVILDAADILIRRNSEQIHTLFPEMHTELTAQTKAGSITYTSYATADQEALAIVAKIKTLLASGVPAEEIAIIYRENSEAEAFTHLLARQGIAFHLEAGDDILKDYDVRQLVNLLTLARNPHDEFALFRYLYAPYSQADTKDLVTLSRLRKRERTSWASLLTEPGPPSTAPTLINWEVFRDLYEKIQLWHRYQETHSIGDTLERVFLDSGLLQWLMREPDHLERLHRVRCFFEEVKGLATTKPHATLEDLFAHLEIRQTYGLPIISPPFTVERSSAIRLMTAHKSKGLEFAHVFIPHFQDGRWSNGGKRDLITLPQGIVAHHVISSEQLLEEERRLLYVALTRAKEAVYLSSAELDSSNRKVLPCQFLSELGEVVQGETQAPAGLLITEFFSPVQSHFTDMQARHYLQEIVAKQPLTPTGLNTYLTCPLEFLYHDIYAIPGIREPYQAYGTAIHKALELWGHWLRTEQVVSREAILRVFQETLQKEGLSEDDALRYQKLGMEVLSAFYEQHHEWQPPLAMEYSFTPHGVMLDGSIPITGKLDKIEPIPGSKLVRVVDYKTGKVRSRNDIEGKTASSDGDYKRQLVFYAVLAEADPFFPYTIGEASLHFIDDAKKFTQETFVITPQEKADLRALIRAVYKEMLELNFEHTPHKKRYHGEESLCDLLRPHTARRTAPMAPVVTQDEVAPTV